VDPDRFHPSQASDILLHLAQVVGLSLENSVVRERLARLSVTDSLTGSRNRRFLQPHNQQPVSQLFGKGIQVACLYVDIDAFKSINDCHGHSVGDDVLSGVVEVASRQMRANDPIIRMGGDEFALLLPGCSLKKADEIGQRIVSASAELPQLGDNRVSVSLGVAFSSADKDMRLKDLIEAADRAMYVAKALGGNRLEVADQAT
jgi:diguanylate cyclase (GGDEF)-like protein